MTTSKALVVNTAAEAYKACKPLLQRLKMDTKQVAAEVAKRYQSLPKLEKAKFAKMVRAEFGWSQRRLQDFVLIGKRMPDKEKLISARSPASKIDATNTQVLLEISQMDNNTLKAAASKGLFNADRDVTVVDIRRFRKTGQLPGPKPSRKKPKTDLDKIRQAMIKAERDITNAAIHISDILAIMEDSGIRDAKGKEATKLIQSFEHLCAQMAAANPVTSNKAFKILRGEL